MIGTSTTDVPGKKIIHAKWKHHKYHHKTNIKYQDICNALFPIIINVFVWKLEIF